MAAQTEAFEQGTLWTRLIATTEHALRTGALVPLRTESATLEAGSGVRFSVRILASLENKARARAQQDSAENAGAKTNPFLPPEPDLTVAHVSATHTAVLNKFNVVENHLLLVTRAFEDQEMLLTLQDFAALSCCLGEYDGLGFYNGGRDAGASQEHKHLQVVPLPMLPDHLPVPIAPLLPASAPDTPVTTPALPFVHAFVRLGSRLGAGVEGARKGFELYSQMLRHVGLEPADSSQPKRQSMAYCFLTTRDWMLLVPRTRETFEGISLNALAFAGSLFVRNEEQHALLRNVGPWNVLRAVTVPERAFRSLG